MTAATAFVRTNIWGRGPRVEVNVSDDKQRTALWCLPVHFIMSKAVICLKLQDVTHKHLKVDRCYV